MIRGSGSYHEQLRRARVEILRAAAVRCGGNRARMAVDLGIHREHVTTLMRELGLVSEFPPGPGGRPRKVKA